MEGIFFSNEHDDDDKEESESKSTKKSAENLGAFLVEPKSEKPKPSLLEGLFMREADNEKSKTENEETAEDAPDSAEELEAIDQLTPAESVAVEQQIVRSRQAESDSDDDEQTQDAIGQFRAKIVDEGKSSDEALHETLDSIESPNEARAEQVDIEQQSGESEPQPIPETVIELSHDEPQPAETNSVPPAPPRQPFGSPFGPAPTFEQPAPTPPAQPETVVVERRDDSGLLVGGIVGYLIGRRRGRIRTEKRLLPIQAKLEKQVEAMQANIIAKEAAIRAAVHENQSQAEATAELQRTTERLRRSAEQPQPNERLVSRPEQSIKGPEAPQQILFAETLSRPQLMAIAENILIDGVPLSRTFEANRITEDGLRRVVGEHLRGGDVPRALRLELIDGEQAFERDPVLRDNIALLPQPQSHSSAIHQPVQQSTEAARIEHQKATLAAQAEHAKVEAKARKQRQRIMDVTLASVIFILLVAIVGLVMARR